MSTIILSYSQLKILLSFVAYPWLLIFRQQETKFIMTNLISFMDEWTNAIEIINCNHSTKNMFLQLFLGSGRYCYDWGCSLDDGLLRIVGFSLGLYYVDGHVPDVFVVKLSSSEIIDSY